MWSGTQVKWAVVNADYHIEEHGSIPTCTSPADQVIETFRSVIEPHRARVRGVGISMPGVFSEGDSDGVVGGAAPFTVWTDIRSVASCARARGFP